MRCSALRVARPLIVSLIATLSLFSTAQTTKPTEARYYPLALGNVWTYHVHRLSSKAPDSTLEWRVTQGGETYQVWPKPMQSDDEAMELAVTRKGIKEISSNTLIIKFPVRAGKCWAAGQSNKSRRFRVLSANKPCSVSQLKIRDCITIGDEDASATGSKTVTTYGLDLGPVLYAYLSESSREGTPRPDRDSDLTQVRWTIAVVESGFHSKRLTKRPSPSVTGTS